MRCNIDIIKKARIMDCSEIFWIELKLKYSFFLEIFNKWILTNIVNYLRWIRIFLVALVTKKHLCQNIRNFKNENEFEWIFRCELKSKQNIGCVCMNVSFFLLYKLFFYNNSIMNECKIGNAQEWKLEQTGWFIIFLDFLVTILIEINECIQLRRIL